MGNNDYQNSCQSNVQIEKYLECLIYVNNDLGILLQNAENLAYKLKLIDKKDMQYLSYDYYNQFEKKDEHTLRKNIKSSLKFLEAQFIAIKQETGKEYIFPPSIEIIKKDVKTWMDKIKEKNSQDLKIFNLIYSVLNNEKFKKKDIENLVKDCLNNNKITNVTPYMWIVFSPPILHNIDKNNEIIHKIMEASGQNMPDIIRGTSETYKEDLIKPQEIYKEMMEINRMIKELKVNKEKGKEINEDQLKFKILDFYQKHQKRPYIEPIYQTFYNKLRENFDK